MTKHTVTINLTPKKILAQLPENFPSYSVGDHYAGAVYSPKPAVKDDYAFAREAIAAVESDSESVTLVLTQRQMLALYFATVVKSVAAYQSGTILHDKNFPIVAALIRGGMKDPKHHMVYN